MVMLIFTKLFIPMPIFCKCLHISIIYYIITIIRSNTTSKLIILFQWPQSWHDLGSLGHNIPHFLIISATHFSDSIYSTLNYILNGYKFALLWGEAQLCLPYVCL